VLPFLKRDKSVVLLDRYYDSSTAYQGAGRELDLAAVKQVNHFATAGLVPHLTFFFDLPLKEARKRKGLESKETDRLESSGDDFYERTRQGYLQICTEEPERMVRLDASLPPDDITTQILHKVKALLR
jgi:dTMP kinase